MGALPPGVSDLHCLLRPCAKVYHLLKRHDCILNRDHCGLASHTLSESFYCHGRLDFRSAELREVFIPSTITLERGRDKYARARQKNILLKQCRSGASRCIGQSGLKQEWEISQAVLFQVLYFKYFLLFANDLWVQTEGSFYKLTTFCCKIRRGKRKSVFKKNQKLLFFISEHIGVNSFGI